MVVLQCTYRKKGETMRAFLIDSKTDECKTVDIEPSLDEYYRLIRCECIDITLRRICGRHYNIVVDDEGLLKPNRASALCVTEGIDEVLAGSLLIFGVNLEECDEDFQTLTDEDILGILSCIKQFEFNDGSVHPVLTYTI